MAVYRDRKTTANSAHTKDMNLSAGITRARYRTMIMMKIFFWHDLKVGKTVGKKKERMSLWEMAVWEILLRPSLPPAHLLPCCESPGTVDLDRRLEEDGPDQPEGPEQGEAVLLLGRLDGTSFSSLAAVNLVRVSLIDGQCCH